MPMNPHGGDLESYMRSLPAYIRESIRQSGLDFTCEEDLRAFVENLQECRSESAPRP